MTHVFREPMTTTSAPASASAVQSSVVLYTVTMRCLGVLLLIGVSAHGWRTEYTSTGQEEGEVCHKQDGVEWICKKDSDCEGLKDVLKENGKLKTCSWKGQSPVLCCPPKQTQDRIRMSKSEEKCLEYSRLLCNIDEVLVVQSQPAALMRKKRQALEKAAQSDETTTSPDHGPRQDRRDLNHSTEVPVLAVAGGRLSLPEEFPSMKYLFQRQTGVETPFTVHNPVAGGHVARPRDNPHMKYLFRRQIGLEKPITVHTQVAGGRIANPRDNPHMALVGYGDEGAINWQCGGSLISENYVLSAAHCVNTAYGLARWVRLGDLDLRSDTEDARPQQREVVERVVHPGYRSPAFYNDLALLRLDRPVRLDSYVRPSCLHQDTRDPPGSGTAAGWGKNETHGPRSSALMQVDISFVPAEECKRLVGVVRKYLPEGVDTATMICAGEQGKDTCQGDSGGPLVLPPSPWSPSDCLARLVGVTSFGPRNCGMTSVPGAYVRVAHFLPWIESIVWPE